MKDLIYKQTAIDAFDCSIWGVPADSVKYVADYADKMIYRIKKLPSVDSETREINYTDCANAMLKMWIDNVLTDGEYYRIMDKLNAYWAERRADEAD